MTQARTIACIGTSYVTKIIAVALLIFAAGELVNLYDLTKQARREG